MGDDRSLPGAGLASAFDALPRIESARRAAGGGRVAIFLDYDGTLTPIVERPTDAILAPRTRRTVEELARVADVTVVSGRALDDLANRVAIRGIVYAGSHGLEVQRPDGRLTLHGDAAAYGDEVRAIRREFDRAVSAMPGVIIEQKRASIAVHFRLAPPESVPAIRETVLEIAAAFPRMRVLPGKAVLELRPRTEWSKGAVVDLLAAERAERAGRGEAPALTICIGDDVTDEDTFRAVNAIGPDGVSIAVDPPDGTAARFALRDPDEVHAWLEALLALLSH